MKFFNACFFLSFFFWCFFFPAEPDTESRFGEEAKRQPVAACLVQRSHKKLQGCKNHKFHHVLAKRVVFLCNIALL